MKYAAVWEKPTKAHVEYLDHRIVVRDLNIDPAFVLKEVHEDGNRNLILKMIKDGIAYYKESSCDAGKVH